MSLRRQSPKLPRESAVQGGALICLLVLGGFVLAGPSGLLAWGENQRMLIDYKAEIADLSIHRDELKNRVALLDPNGADKDLAGELLRRNLNVVHPDEMVILLD